MRPSDLLLFDTTPASERFSDLPRREFRVTQAGNMLMADRVCYYGRTMGKLVVLMITAFVDMVGFAMVLPLIPFYATQMGATGFVVGLLISAFSVAQLLSAATWGHASDRFGRRPAVVAGLLVSAVAYVVFGLATTLWVLLASRLVQGIGGGTVGVLQAWPPGSDCGACERDADRTPHTRRNTVASRHSRR
jgi:Na+/melibiose symporter-like transporter